MRSSHANKSNTSYLSIFQTLIPDFIMPKNIYHRNSNSLSSSYSWICCMAFLACILASHSSVEAQCRSSTGRPISCSIYPNYQYANHRRHHLHNMTNILRRSSGSYYKSQQSQISKKPCYCDRQCIAKNDCCPNAWSVCHKRESDCRVSEWGPWTSCSQACGLKWQLRRRKYLEEPANGGADCPRLEERRPCPRTRCLAKRVSRSGALMVPYIPNVKSEVAHLLPVRGNVLHLTRRFDMRWDERRKLYLGRLVMMNKTEQPEPEPYCAMYEITLSNPACQAHNILGQMSNLYSSRHRFRSRRATNYYGSDDHTMTFTRHTVPYNRGSTPNLNPSLLWNEDDNISRAWLTHAALLRQGQQICVTCYSAYMREDLGYRCTGSALPNVELRWRALRTADCQGRFRMITVPQRSCTCGRGAASFVFV